MLRYPSVCVRMCFCLHWLVQRASLSAQCCLAEVYNHPTLHQIHLDTHYCTAFLLFVAFSHTCHTIWQSSSLPKCIRAAGHSALVQHTALSNTKLTLTSWTIATSGPSREFLKQCTVLIHCVNLLAVNRRALSSRLSWPSLWPSSGKRLWQNMKCPTGITKPSTKHHFKVHISIHTSPSFILSNLNLEKCTLIS